VKALRSAVVRLFSSTEFRRSSNGLKKCRGSEIEYAVLKRGRYADDETAAKEEEPVARGRTAIAGSPG
jgi:hypothetical protein